MTEKHPRSSEGGKVVAFISRRHKENRLILCSETLDIDFNEADHPNYPHGLIKESDLA